MLVLTPPRLKSTLSSRWELRRNEESRKQQLWRAIGGVMSSCRSRVIRRLELGRKAGLGNQIWCCARNVFRRAAAQLWIEMVGRIN